MKNSKHQKLCDKTYVFHVYAKNREAWDSRVSGVLSHQNSTAALTRGRHKYCLPISFVVHARCMRILKNIQKGFSGMEGKSVEQSAAFWTQHSLYPLAVEHCLISSSSAAIPHRDREWVGKRSPAVFPRIKVTVSTAYPTLSSCVPVIHATKFFYSYFVLM